MTPVAVAVAPDQPDWIVEAVRAGGAVLAGPSNARVLVWMEPATPQRLADYLCDAPHIEWVQLPWAGVEPYVRAGLVGDGRTWSSAKGVYRRPVGEHALALVLASLRTLPVHARRGGWGPQAGTSLDGASVVIFGRGGIAAELAHLLAPFACRITCVARTAEPVEWAHRVVATDDRHDALADADVVVLALSLSPATDRIIGAAELARMKPGAHLVNIARGRHVDTGALLDALQQGRLAGAALDVTDPEPLPADHPLWTVPNCLITPHTAVTAEMSHPLLAERITENLRRFAAGQTVIGIVDPERGY